MFYSALMLTGVNLLLRFAGTTFQVYLSGRIGAEGIGLLQLVLSIGSLAMVAGMGGIRTATMYLTAEELGKGRPENIKWVLSSCMLYSVLISGSVSIIVTYFSPLIASAWIGNVNATIPIQLLAVFLPVNCLCGVMSGYFTGANRIGTLAVVEVAEQLLSLGITMGLLTFWAANDAVKSCLCVIIGSGGGACLTLVCLTLLRLAERAMSAPRFSSKKRLFNTAIPLAIADDLRTGISTAENIIVPKRLALYPGVLSPLAAFGTVCGMVFPILMFPAAILFGLTELLIPEMARCNASGNIKRIRYLTSKSLHVTLIFGTICAGILFLAANELCAALYKNEAAGVYLQYFAPLATMLYCDIMIDSMIKGLGYQKISVCFNILTNAMDIFLLYFLLPVCGIRGYFLSFLLTHIVNFVLSLFLLIKISNYRIRIKKLTLTLISSIFSAWACNFISAPLFRCCCYVVILLILLYILGVINRTDIAWLKKIVMNKKCACHKRTGTSSI